VIGVDISGKPNEGWMAILPLTIFFGFIVLAMGGPASFMNTVAVWASDVVSYVGAWIKYL
jgi:hypothetical protein